MDIKTLLLTVVPIAWGLVVKYHPAWKTVPNAIIPWATFAVALVTAILAPTPAHAGTVAVVGAQVGGFLGPILLAGWRAILNSLIYEVFLRHPVVAVLTKQ